MKRIIFSIILSFLTLLIVLPSTVSADVPDPKFLSSKCNLGEKEIVCDTGRSLNPSASGGKNECTVYLHNPEYRRIYSDYRSEKYCYKSLSQNEKLLTYAKSLFLLIFLTILLEAPIYYIFGFKSIKNIAQVFLVNILTVSVLFLVTTYAPNSGVLTILIMEVLIIALEAILLHLLNKTYRFKKILLASLVANLVSAIIGSFILNFFL